MIGYPCPACCRIHPGDAVRAIGRFNPYTTPAWRANYTGSPPRVTREAAVTDWCRHTTNLGYPETIPGGNPLDTVPG